LPHEISLACLWIQFVRLTIYNVTYRRVVLELLVARSVDHLLASSLRLKVRNEYFIRILLLFFFHLHIFKVDLDFFLDSSDSSHPVRVDKLLCEVFQKYRELLPFNKHFHRFLHSGFSENSVALKRTTGLLDT